MPQGFDKQQLIWIVPAVFGLLGVMMAGSGLGRIFRGRVISGPLGALSGLALLAGGAATGLLGLNIQTYNRLTFEQPVAVITLRAGETPQSFVATVREAEDNQAKEYPLTGDEWQLDARVLKWKPWANVFGLDSQYRLERLTGRFSDFEQAKTTLPEMHQLSENRGLDLWDVARRYGKVVPMADTLQGSASFMPMADGASYAVTVTQAGGLLARPENEIAQKAMENWK